MSQATYQLYADFDRDGFFCANVSGSDQLNLIPSPVLWHGLYFAPATANSTATPEAETTDYGVKRLVIDTGADAGGGVYVGQHPDTGDVANIPARGDGIVTFFVQVWLKTISGSNKPTLKVIDQDGNILATSAPALTSSWAVYSLDFIPATSVTYIKIQITFAAAAATVCHATGFMLTPPNPGTGSPGTPPSAFNAGDATNLLDDISAYLLEASWMWGIQQYGERMAQPASLTASLKNIDGNWTPEQGAYGTYVSKGMLVKLQATFGGTIYPLFIGTLASLKVDSGAYGARTATLVLEDCMVMLQHAEYQPSLLTNVTTDEPIQDVFDDAVVAWPYPGTSWILEAGGYSELDNTTALYTPLPTSFSTGDTTLAFTGDLTDSNHPVNAQTQISEYVYAELGGRFWFDPTTDIFHFTNRSYDLLNAPPGGSSYALNPGELDSAPVFVWGDDVITQIDVGYYPRVVGAANSVLYTQGNLPLSLTSGQTRTFTARYSDPNAQNATVAGKNMVRPVSGTDYAANAASDGSGADKTDMLLVLANYAATSATVTLINQDAGTIYVTLLQLRGTPLTAYQRVSARSIDGAAQAAQGLHQRSIDLPALSDADLAEDFANYLVQRYKTPYGRFAEVTVNLNRDDTALINGLSLGVNDYISVTDSWLQNTLTKYTIIGVRHHVTPIGLHDKVYVLEPLYRSTLWILDDTVFSVLDTSTRLSL